MGMKEAILLESSDADWGPMATANAIVEAAKEHGPFDLLMFGNESADSGGYQVGVRVAHALDMPCVTNVKALEFDGGTLAAKKEISGGHEVYELSLPAVVTVKEGLNYPRYPSVPGRLRAKKAPIATMVPPTLDEGFTKLRLHVPSEEVNEVEVLGEGVGAAPKIVDMMKELGLIA